MIKQKTTLMMLALISTPAFSASISSTSLSDRAHQAYLKVSKIQSAQTKSICYDNTYGGGFEFASGYLIQGDYTHAREALGYEIEELKIASRNSCKKMDVISWAADEAVRIKNLIPEK